jgi:MFS transporter, SET family, sugar efflux transporter
MLHFHDAASAPPPARTGRGGRHPLAWLLAGVLLLGAADSISASYLVLFGADRLNLSPFAIGVFMSLTGVSGMVASAWLGRRYDRAPSRMPALLAVAAAAGGYALLTITTSYAALLLIAATFLGTATAAFPQLFTLARRYLDAQGPTAATRGTPALRSSWSLAWAIGPLVGAAVLAAHGFPAVFAVTAVAFAMVAVPVLLLGPLPTAPRPDLGASTGAAQPSRHVVSAVLSFALFHAAMFSGSVVLPLYVTRVLDGSNSDVGLLFSICALVEIPAALGVMLLPASISKARVIIVGMLLLVAYFALAVGAASMPVLVLAQAARGVAIAVVGALGITYFQDLLPDQTGRATMLFSNSATAGSLAAGVVAGATAQALGYRAALLLCGVLAATAVVLFLEARRHRPTHQPLEATTA